MNELQKIEYGAVIKEYGAMVHNVYVEDTELVVETLEKTTYRITVDPKGWQIMTDLQNEEPEIYETPESLLMAKSPKFAGLWHKKLYEQLLNVESGN